MTFENGQRLRYSPPSHDSDYGGKAGTVINCGVDGGAPWAAVRFDHDGKVIVQWADCWEPGS